MRLSSCARYLIGADGSRSAVRECAGIAFHGSTYEQGFFLADVDIEWEHGHEQIHANLTPTHFMQIFPMPGTDYFRLICTLTTEQSDWKTISFEQIQEIVAGTGLDAKLSNPGWIAIYRVHKRHTDRFQSGRVFLAGDSAHIHSPAGGQGMNMSMTDAVNLAWKLASVIRGESFATLLTSYEAERLPVVEHIMNTSDKGFALQATTNPVLQRVRQVVLPLVAHMLSAIPGGEHLIFDIVSQLGVGYPESPIVETADGASRVVAGERAPQAKLTKHDKKSNMFEMLKGFSHQVILCEGPTPHPDFGAMCDDIEQATRRFATPMRHIPMTHEEEDVHRVYHVKRPTVFLIRPDGHIGYRGPLDNPEPMTEYMNKIYAPRHRPQLTAEIVASASAI